MISGANPLIDLQRRCHIRCLLRFRRSRRRRRRRRRRRCRHRRR